MNRIAIALALMTAVPLSAQEPYRDWRHSGSFYLLTTPEGANLPATATIREFPTLVRLHKDFFPFEQAAANGADLRFATAAGVPLAYQIDEWNPREKQASVWVRVPVIEGNARQEIKLYWGNPAAASESSGKAVFNTSNGYAAVLHLSDPASEDVNGLPSTNKGTTETAGVIGKARGFAAGQGINCGDSIASLPTGSSPHTSEAWVRAEQSNGRIVAWGMEKGQGKVVLHIASPPHVRTDCYFSNGNVEGKGRVPMNEWMHVAYTYQNGDARVYVNGRLDGVSKSSSGPLNVPSPAKMAIGGWYNTFNFVGDVDEVRISNIVRSADWLKLQYENQKLLQTFVGPLVRPGDAFTVTPPRLTVLEGDTATVTANVGGAQKIYWVLKRDGQESVVAVDRLAYEFNAGRVVGDTQATLQVKAVYPSEVKVKEIPIAIREHIPEPEIFGMIAPKTWDGRQTIEIVPKVANVDAMQVKGAGRLRYQWDVSGLATIKEIAPGKLILKRAQNSGALKITVRIDNGGRPTEQSTTIAVREPKSDPWIPRHPTLDEKPVDNQFYARDDANEGTLICNGTLPGEADAVYLKITADGQPYKSESRKLGGDRAYAFAVKLKPGLIKYAAELGSTTAGRDTVIHSAKNLVCGDAYIIQGQSNAVASDFGKEDPEFTSDWIRTFGTMANIKDGVHPNLWANAVARNRKGTNAEIGYWGVELAKRLVDEHKVPICIINGAVGGTRIDQHQRNASDPTDATTIYGRLLRRVQEAKLTHGIRGILWHQGENDQGADGPTGGFGWETYQAFFIDLAAAWKSDYPNVRNYYMFQIWPRSCSMGVGSSDSMLREVQRSLPRQFSNLRIMSTLGIKPPGGCHFPAAGYAEFARLMCPLVERDNYGKRFTHPIAPANLESASFAKNDELLLQFDQPMAWNPAAAAQIFLDGAKANITSGAAEGNTIRVKLAAPSSARRVSYLDGRSWNQDQLLWGGNGIAALTFCDVPLAPTK